MIKEPNFAFSESERVWVSNLATPKGKCKKLLPKFTGPSYVVDFKPPVTYWLRDCKTHKNLRHPVHVDRLKPFNDYREQFEQHEDEQKRAEDTTIKTPDDEIETEDVNAPELDKNLNHGSVTPSQEVTQRPEDQSQNTDQWFTVEKVLKARGPAGQREYLVQWEEHKTKSWVTEKDVNQILKEFHTKKTLAGKKRKRE